MPLDTIVFCCSIVETYISKGFLWIMNQTLKWKLKIKIEFNLNVFYKTMLINVHDSQSETASYSVGNLDTMKWTFCPWILKKVHQDSWNWWQSGDKSSIQFQIHCSQTALINWVTIHSYYMRSHRNSSSLKSPTERESGRISIIKTKELLHLASLIESRITGIVFESLETHQLDPCGNWHRSRIIYSKLWW